MSLESQLSRAGYAYDNRMPDEETAAEAAYRELERITDDPDELQDALVEDGMDSGLARVIAARYAGADAELRREIDAVVEGVVKKRGEVKTKALSPENRALVDWIKALAGRVLALEQAAMHSKCIPCEEIERLRKGHERYETARRMSPHQWQDAWAFNLSTGKPFDDIVDGMRSLMFPDECRLPPPESAETSREGHNTESMK